MEGERSVLARIFLTPQERRLRSGWRLLGFALLAFIFLMVFSLPIGILATFFPGITQNLLLLTSLIAFPALTAAVFAARRLLDRRTIVSLGLHWDARAIRDISFGIVLTGLMMGLIYLVFWTFGWLAFEGYVWEFEPFPAILRGVFLMLFVFILVGWYEELMSRGYWLQNIAVGLNLFWGVLLSSIAFALLHLFNPNADWLSALGLVGAGLFLAYGYLRTGLLWLPVGLHIGWNFFEGTVFGFPVSGITIFRLLHHQVIGPELITGGAFGPEGGLVLFPILLIGAGLIQWYTRGRSTELSVQ
jgi:uncharacterized protein